MLRTPAFEAFVAPARYRPAIWRLLLALPLGILVYSAVAVLVAVALVLTLFGEVDSLTDLSLAFAQEMATGATPRGMAVVLATFLGLALAAVAMAGLHRRGPRSLFAAPGVGAWPFWRDAALGTGVVVGLSGALFLLGNLDGGPDLVRQVPAGTWLAHLVWALPLLMVQITAEELVFRGYLPQALAARFRSALLWFLLPAVLFGMGHYDPTLDPRLGWSLVAVTGAFGLIAADLVRVTGSLGAAMGLHLGNNFLALMVVAMPDQLGGLALYHLPFTMAETATVGPLLVLDAATLLVVWGVLRLVLARLRSFSGEAIPNGAADATPAPELRT